MQLKEAIQRLHDAEIENPQFEAQILLAHLLGISRAAVIAGMYTLTTEQAQRFEQAIAMRAAYFPSAYLRGVQEFYGLPFRVRPGVLIPRPETELLVQFALEKRREWQADGSHASPVLADIGTGSGAIAVAVLAHWPEAQAVGVDVSEKALAVARVNAFANGVADRLWFVRADLLNFAPAARFDLILSNPPYIPTRELEGLQPEVHFEPRLALDGGADGLNAYRRLAAEGVRALRPGGWLAVEVGMGQASDVAWLVQKAGFASPDFRLDLAGIERVVIAQKMG